MRKAGPACFDLIKSFESCKLEAYPDPGPLGWKLPTIGWGHTGRDVVKGDVITQEQADGLLASDVDRFARGVDAWVDVPLTQNQFDALVCFCYNIGLSEFQSSTLLRKLNAGLPMADEFLRWNKSGNVVMAGLTRRRYAERKLFNTPDQGPSDSPPSMG